MDDCEQCELLQDDIGNLRAALHTIRAFAEQRISEGTRERADMCHIANIAKEVA